MEKTSEKMRRAVVPVSMTVGKREEPAGRPNPVWIREREGRAGFLRHRLALVVALVRSGDKG